jgi:LemA protein
MTVFAIAGGIGLLLVLFIIGTYNGLVRSRNGVKNSWSQIDVQLKRRYDLIPNLIETAKGYMKHERDTLEAVTRMRQQAINVSGTNVAAKAEIENMLSDTLKSLFAVAENYPDLKANQNFLALQEELTSTENKIGFARQYYNDSTMSYNNKIEVFPSNIFAGLFGFKASDFFAVEEAGMRQAPQVKF